MDLGNAAAEWNIEEVGALVRGLSPDEQNKLRYWGRIYAAGTGLMGDDLVHSAFVTVLSGDRRCGKDVPFTAFMHGTIRSLADTAQSSVWRTRVDALSSKSATEQRVIEPVAHNNVPRDLIHKETLDRIFSLFADDDQLSEILLYRSQGYEPQEIQQTLQLTSTQYDSALRQIRRVLNQRYPNGWDR
ncbi:MAG: RNA polymerase sigma factor [Sulfuricaulis sp.]